MLPWLIKLKIKPDVLINLTPALLLCSQMNETPFFHPLAQARRNLGSLQLFLSFHSHFSQQLLSSWPLWTHQSIPLLHLLCPRSCSHHHFPHRLLQEAPPTCSQSWVSPAPVCRVHGSQGVVISLNTRWLFHHPHATALLKNLHRLLSYREKPQFFIAYQTLQNSLSYLLSCHTSTCTDAPAIQKYLHFLEILLTPFVHAVPSAWTACPLYVWWTPTHSSRLSWEVLSSYEVLPNSPSGKINPSDPSVPKALCIAPPTPPLWHLSGASPH